jgi:hypothetical protein
MITPTTQSVQPTIVYDGLWIKNIAIQAPSPLLPIRATIVVNPYSSASGSLSPVSKNIIIQDVFSLAATSSYVANAMGSIFAYVQDQVVSQSLF